MHEESSAEDRSSSPIDRFIDELLPEDLEWRRLAGAYPLASLAVAAAGGFWIGRQHGPTLLRAASDLLSREMTNHVQGLFGSLSGDGGSTADGEAADRASD